MGEPRVYDPQFSDYVPDETRSGTAGGPDRTSPGQSSPDRGDHPGIVRRTAGRAADTVVGALRAMPDIGGPMMSFFAALFVLDFLRNAPGAAAPVSGGVIHGFGAGMGAIGHVLGPTAEALGGAATATGSVFGKGLGAVGEGLGATFEVMGDVGEGLSEVFDGIGDIFEIFGDLG